MKSKLFLVLALALAGLSCCPHYSDGSRVGVVTKFSRKGFFWKSWEGELLMGGLVATRDADGNPAGMAANVFEFNADPAVVADLQQAMRTGKRVELLYRQWAISPISIGNNHVVIKVKVLE